MSRDLVCPECGEFGFESKYCVQSDKGTLKCYECGAWSDKPKWMTVKQIIAEVERLTEQNARLKVSRQEEIDRYINECSYSDNLERENKAQIEKLESDYSRLLETHRESVEDGNVLKWNNAGLTLTVDQLRAELKESVEEGDRLRGALQAIADPVEHLRREAEKDGCILNGIAYSVSRDPEWLISLAKEAIQALPIKETAE